MKNDITCCVLNAFQYVMTIFSVENLQRIELCIAILTSIFILTCKVIEWAKRSKKDKTLDDQELNELKDIIKDGMNEIKNDMEGRDK